MRGSEFMELRALMAIAECGNFARAAARLALTPSALSQTIKSLEQRHGVRLLNRTTRSVAATEAGAALIARLHPLLAELDAAVADLASHRHVPRGTLRINAPRRQRCICWPLNWPGLWHVALRLRWKLCQKRD